MEEEPLPPGWAMSVAANGRPFFINHNTHATQWVGTATGASHASHLGCPSAYSSRLSYIKKRQVWKSRSETDWPHLGIMPGFSTEKNRSILMLTSSCWQDISLSNTVELTTVTPQKQKICRFKRRFLPFLKIPEVPLSAYAQQILWRAMIGRFCFYVRPRFSVTASRRT